MRKVHILTVLIIFLMMVPSIAFGLDINYMTIGLTKETSTCSMLTDGDEARQKQENGTKNTFSDDRA